MARRAGACLVCTSLLEKSWTFLRGETTVGGFLYHCSSPWVFVSSMPEAGENETGLTQPCLAEQVVGAAATRGKTEQPLPCTEIHL